MKYNFLIAFGIGIAILLVGSTSFIFAQTNESNQTAGQENTSIFTFDTLSNMSNITTPGGNANTYR
jgi:hypothetical protein